MRLRRSCCLVCNCFQKCWHQKGNKNEILCCWSDCSLWLKFVECGLLAIKTHFWLIQLGSHSVSSQEKSFGETISKRVCKKLTSMLLLLSEFESLTNVSEPFFNSFVKCKYFSKVQLNKPSEKTNFSNVQVIRQFGRDTILPMLTEVPFRIIFRK